MNKNPLDQSVTRLPVYDRDATLSEIARALPRNAFEQSTDELQYMNNLYDDTDPELLAPPESEVRNYFFSQICMSFFSVQYQLVKRTTGRVLTRTQC